MAEWWNLSPSDLLLFSPRVYARLFVLHNQHWWPLHLAGLALGAGIAWSVWRSNDRVARATTVLLGLTWIWVAWAFLWERYGDINWAVRYVAPVFVLEGLLLIALGASGAMQFGVRGGLGRAVGLALVAIGLVGYPLLAPATGRPWIGGEAFGLVADPTAVVTLGVLVASRGGWSRVALVIPVVWCAITGATLWVLEDGAFVIAPACAVFALLTAILTRRG